MNSFAIGASNAETVVVTVLNYVCPQTGEFYDDNWLLCEVAVQAGAFRGKFQANFLTAEIDDLLQGLSRLHQELQGRYTFEPMEGQLVLAVSCDSLSHIHVDAKAMDVAGIGHRLAFKFSLDQTYLSSTLLQLSEVARAFPVRA